MPNRTMKVTLKVERDDGSYQIDKWTVPDWVLNGGSGMVKEQMRIGHTLQRLMGQVEAMPPKQEADEL